MNYESDLIYKIDISQIKGVGDITAKKLISHWGSAENHRFVICKTFTYLWDKTNIKLAKFKNIKTYFRDGI